MIFVKSVQSVAVFLFSKQLVAILLKIGNMFPSSGDDGL
jgi:hypothetical protein